MNTNFYSTSQMVLKAPAEAHLGQPASTCAVTSAATIASLEHGWTMENRKVDA